MNMLATLLMVALQALTVQGVVFKKGANEPLSEATVELRKDQENGAILKSLTTDGRFLFDDVAPGRYRVTVTRRGYTRPPLTITVRAQASAAELRLAMTPAGAISGHIYNASGAPMGNIEVLAMKASYPEGRRTLTPVQSVVTNDLGEYRLFWLTPGRYYVSAVHPSAQGMFRRMFSMFGMGVSAGGISIGGMLYASANSDPALAALSPDIDAESERYAPVFFGNVIDEQSASAIDIRAGAEVEGANITIAPVRPRRVRGVVVDGISGRPAEYASVTEATGFDGPPGHEIEVDREAASFSALLLPGWHTVNATSAGGEGSLTFQVLDADIENLVIPTTPTFDTPGRIVIEGEPGNAALLGALQITLRPDPPRKEPSSGGFEYSTPLANGTFVVSASAGDYRLNISPLLNVTPSRVAMASLPAVLQNAYVKSVRLGTTDALEGPLHLERKPSGLLEVVIGKNSGAVEGQASDPQGAGSDISVVLVPDVRRRTELYRTTIADASGRFHFDRVPPGDYKLFAWTEVEDGVWFDPEFVRQNENHGAPIRVMEGRTESARLEVIP